MQFQSCKAASRVVDKRARVHVCRWGGVYRCHPSTHLALSTMQDIYVVTELMESDLHNVIDVNRGELTPEHHKARDSFVVIIIIIIIVVVVVTCTTRHVTH